MTPTVVQNQALYLTTLYNRKDSWLAVRDETVKLFKAASGLTKNSILGTQELVALKAATIILQQEINSLDNVHKVFEQ